MRPVLAELAAIPGAPALPRDRLDELRDRKLRRIVRHAYERVPFYRRKLDEAGVRPDDIRSAADLPHLPLTARDELQHAGVEARLAAGFRREALEARHTSGSTGRPLEVRMSPWDSRIRRLVELRTMHRAGLRINDRLVTLGPSRSVPPSLHQRLGFYRTEIITGLLPIEEQIEKLRELRPDVLWIYPTVLGAIYERGFRLRDYVEPRRIYCSGETLEDSVRERLEADLGLAPLNFYGSLELGRIAAQCPARTGLHVNEDHVIVEIVRESGSPADEPAVGSVLVTGLNARAMPLLRYRIGDLAAWRDGPCPCGSPFRLIEPPLGRSSHCVVLPSGRRMTAHRCYFALREVEGLLRFQIIQEAANRLRFRLVTAEPPAPGAVERLKAAVVENLGESIGVEVERVDRIAQEGLKFQEFISRLPDSR